MLTQYTESRFESANYIILRISGEKYKRSWLVYKKNSGERFLFKDLERAKNRVKKLESK